MIKRLPRWCTICMNSYIRVQNKTYNWVNFRPIPYLVTRNMYSFRTLLSLENKSFDSTLIIFKYLGGKSELFLYLCIEITITVSQMNSYSVQLNICTHNIKNTHYFEMWWVADISWSNPASSATKNMYPNYESYSPVQLSVNYSKTFMQRTRMGP